MARANLGITPSWAHFESIYHGNDDKKETSVMAFLPLNCDILCLVHYGEKKWKKFVITFREYH